MYGKLTARMVTMAIRMENPNPRASPATITVVRSMKIRGESQYPVMITADTCRATSASTRSRDWRSSAYLMGLKARKMAYETTIAVQICSDRPYSSSRLVTSRSEMAVVARRMAVIRLLKLATRSEAMLGSCWATMSKSPVGCWAGSTSALRRSRDHRDRRREPIPPEGVSAVSSAAGWNGMPSGMGSSGEGTSSVSFGGAVCMCAPS